MKVKITLMALAAAVALGSMVSPADAKKRHMPRFEFSQIDLNSDGQITRQEVATFQQTRFNAADQNNDGFLTVDELTAQLAEFREGDVGDRGTHHIERMINRLDANNDNQLSFDEQSASERVSRMFERLDENSDGVISEEEAKTARGMHKDRKQSNPRS